MITELVSLLTSLDASKSGKSPKFSVNLNRNHIRSISAYSSNSIFYFQTIVSDQVTPEEMGMISRALEKSYASFVVTCISLMPFHRIKADDQASIEEYLSQFHQNLGIKAGNSNAAAKMLNLVNTLEESNTELSDIPAEDLEQTRDFLMECWEKSRANCTDFIKIVQETVSLNDMYNADPIDPVTRVMQEQYWNKMDELDTWGFIGEATADVLDDLFAADDDDEYDDDEDDFDFDDEDLEDEYSDDEIFDEAAYVADSVEALCESSACSPLAATDQMLLDEKSIGDTVSDSLAFVYDTFSSTFKKEGVSVGEVSTFFDATTIIFVVAGSFIGFLFGRPIGRVFADIKLHKDIKGLKDEIDRLRTENKILSASLNEGGIVGGGARDAIDDITACGFATTFTGGLKGLGLGTAAGAIRGYNKEKKQKMEEIDELYQQVLALEINNAKWRAEYARRNLPLPSGVSPEPLLFSAKFEADRDARTLRVRFKKLIDTITSKFHKEPKVVAVSESTSNLPLDHLFESSACEPLVATGFAINEDFDAEGWAQQVMSSPGYQKMMDMISGINKDTPRDVAYQKYYDYVSSIGYTGETRDQLVSNYMKLNYYDPRDPNSEFAEPITFGMSSDGSDYSAISAGVRMAGKDPDEFFEDLSNLQSERDAIDSAAPSASTSTNSSKSSSNKPSTDTLATSLTAVVGVGSGLIGFLFGRPIGRVFADIQARKDIRLLRNEVSRLRAENLKFSIALTEAAGQYATAAGRGVTAGLAGGMAVGALYGYHKEHKKNNTEIEDLHQQILLLEIDNAKYRDICKRNHKPLPAGVSPEPSMFGQKFIEDRDAKKLRNRFKKLLDTIKKKFHKEPKVVAITEAMSQKQALKIVKSPVLAPLRAFGKWGAYSPMGQFGLKVGQAYIRKKYHLDKKGRPLNDDAELDDELEEIDDTEEMLDLDELSEDASFAPLMIDVHEFE